MFICVTCKCKKEKNPRSPEEDLAYTVRKKFLGESFVLRRVLNQGCQDWQGRRVSMAFSQRTEEIKIFRPSFQKYNHIS
jgi:hypothetical protein